MRIKRLDLCGFKSFVDPTSLEFSRGTSGIVGPNGCGKSNLVDALRWVLGEQSARRLRGDLMEDVIFNGTESGRGPSGMAEVSLVLENEEPAEAIEDPSEIYRQLREVPEIQVTRRYFRSGESEYLINNRPCRLKDVTELFLGTGVGTKAYALIEQGRVDQLVNAKPGDIRLFIEEAAGTTLYRDRRLAAERKMERTRDNLARVSDILQEVDRNIALYRRVAKRAELYRQCQLELREVELQLARRRLERLDRELSQIDERRHALREAEADLTARIERLETDREGARARLATAEGELRARQEALFEIRTTRSRAQAHLEMLDREELDARDQAGRLDRDREHGAARVAALALEIEQRERALVDLARRNRDDETRLAVLLEAVSAEERDLEGLHAAVEQEKTENVERQRTEADLRNRLRAGEERCAERRRRRESLAAETAAATAEIGRLSGEADRLAAQCGTLGERIARERDELTTSAQSLAQLRSQKSATERAAITTAAGLAEAQSRLGAAEEVERGYGRYHEGVRAVMRKHGESRNGVLNLVAEVIDAPPEFEKAVAAVLGERLQCVVVRTPEDARDAIRELKEEGSGRSNFIPVEPRRPYPVESAASAASPRDGSTGLLEVVRVEEGYGALAESLLGDAVLVDDLDQGIELWRRNGRWRTLVTREGEVVHPDGVVGGGSSGPYEERLLAQRREIRRLRDEVERLAGDVAELERQRTERIAELTAAERRCAGLEESLRAATIEQVGLEKDAERVSQDLDRAQASLERSRAEDRRLEAEIAAILEETSAAERAIEEAAAALSLGDDRRREIEADLAARRASLDAKSGSAMELKISLAQAREKEEALGEGLEQVTAQREEIKQRLERLGAECEAIAARGVSRANEQQSLRAELDRSRADEQERLGAFEESRAGAEQLRREIEEAERGLTQARGELDRVRQERAASEVAFAEQTLRRDNTIGAMRERYQAELTAIEVDESDESELEARCQSLQEKIGRMDRSAIGLEAMEELGSMEERRAFLANEKADLERSIADLQKTISNLNRVSRDRFAETFAAVNEKFRETFPKLFRGGRAYLALTDENDL
ncbi:MAG TPA: chromosome segregation protein SMC, partial [Candidatus Binatia bacterium]|nr:chromosome segregation protein SMC [Candidatus Binatia bacterium]